MELGAAGCDGEHRLFGHGNFYKIAQPCNHRMVKLPSAGVAYFTLPFFTVQPYSGITSQYFNRHTSATAQHTDRILNGQPVFFAYGDNTCGGVGIDPLGF